MVSALVTTATTRAAFRQNSSGSPGGGGERVLRALRRYVAVTMTYGAVRAVTYDRGGVGDGNGNYYNTRTHALENKPMLFTHAVGHVVGRACVAVLDLPWLLGEDITRLECAVRGLPFAAYSRRHDH
jgi:hypothetical protein